MTNKVVDSSIRQDYLDFLDDSSKAGVYAEKVDKLIKNNQPRLFVNINDLRKSKPNRARNLLKNSFEELVIFETALKDYINGVNPDFLLKVPEVFIGLEGSFGSKHVTPRTLSSLHLGQIVCIEGIVTKCSLVRPKVMKSVHFCPATKKIIERRYTDLTSYDAFPSSTVYPTKDDDGNLLETEFGLSTFKDHQTFTIQEMPEKAPAGQLPRSVDIIADNDLVDQCKPGDRVQVIGTFRCLPSKQGSYTSGTFRTILLANNVIPMSKEVSPTYTLEDSKRYFAFGKRANIFNELAQSIAPSIYGHDMIKKALLCMLLGGVEKILPNGSRIRGDINILLVGDPSVAKSQMLRYVLHTAPRAIATTGRGSSGVGLTAAVTNDFETGERRLEAGAMVLADRGIVCIDEFDKMSDIDRTAIHEVMEQGRVTITKAGIHAKLNARCSVLAAANPVYGKYDKYKTPMENIGLQDSLLSRFDLLFILLDEHNREIDGNISQHVMRMHMYRGPTEEDGEPLPIISTADFLSTRNIDETAEDNGEVQIYEKNDKSLYGDRASRKKNKIISMEFMRRYLYLAKRKTPVLTERAGKTIAEAYAKFRCHEQDFADKAITQPVTARSLETLIRIATAHAKARLSDQVEPKDAKAAIELLNFAIFKEVIKKPKKRKPRADGQGEETEEESDEDSDGDDSDDQRGGKRMSTEDPYEFDEDDEERRSRRKQPRKPRATTSVEEVGRDEAGTSLNGQNGHSEVSDTPMEVEVEVNEDRFKQFKKLLSEEFRKQQAQSLLVNGVKQILRGDGSNNFSDAEIDLCLKRMSDDNAIMISDSVIFWI
ncbi:minichromosome maintenance 3 [Brevipalpus obovatus]|uniref:minichromosome maintenance 3 n=1 Tax=Brevipalpus obovatus TaxID=246614 RepID=UPI003D9DFB70